MRRVLVTGTAGFIGFHFTKLLLADGIRVHGYDGISQFVTWFRNYYRK